MAKILIIDDSQVMRDLLSDFLCDAGHSVDVAADGAEGVRRAVENDYDLCICDTHMPKMTGEDVLREIKAAKPDAQFIFTDSLPDQNSEKIRRIGAYYCLKKPFDLNQLREVLEKLLRTVKQL